MSTDPSTVTRELVLVSVADNLYAIDIMRVREIRGWTGSTPLPHAPPYVLGIFNLRGATLPIVDLGARLSGRTTTVERSSVIVVVEMGRRMIGLLVDAVCDIIAPKHQEVQPPPDVGEEAVYHFVDGVLPVEDNIVKLLCLDNILPTEERRAA